MATVAEMMVIISAKSQKLQKELKNSIKDVTNFSKRTTELSKEVAQGVGFLGVAVAGLGVSAVKMAANMEQTQIAFETLLGSAQNARSFLADLSKFAANTPFEMKGLTSASQVLLGFGFDAKRIIPMLTSMGDAIAAMGKTPEDLQRLAIIFGQIQAKGKLQGDELLQMSEMGINGLKMLADAAGVSAEEMQKRISDGAIKSDQAIAVLLAGMDARFKGAMEKQSKSMNGLFSTLVDNSKQIAITIGNTLIEAFNIKETLTNVGNLVAEFNKLSQTIGLVPALDKVLNQDVQRAIVAIAGAIAGALVPALFSLGAAMVPLLPFIAAGAVIAAIAFTIYKNWGIIVSFFTTTIPSAIQIMIGWFMQIPIKLDQFLAQLPGIIMYGIGYAMGLAIKLLSAGVYNLTEGIKRIPQDFAMYLEMAKQAVINGFRAIVQFGSNLMKSFRKDTSDNIRQVPNDFKSIGESILNYLSGLAGRLMDKGKQIAAGFWEGFKKGLGISSPSYVEEAFMSIGNQGLTTGKDLIKSAKLYQVAAERIANPFTVSNFGVPALATAANTAYNPTNAVNTVMAASAPTTAPVQTNDLDQPQPFTIIIQQMNVKNEDDIKKVSQELYKIQLAAQRGSGSRQVY